MKISYRYYLCNMFIFIMLLTIISNCKIPANAELIVTHEFDAGEDVHRILQDNESGFWIVGFLQGLYYLYKDGDNWSLELYENIDIIDAAGPTSEGLIYCTCRSNDPGNRRGVVIFDCNTRQYMDVYENELFYRIRHLTITSDDKMLYITVDSTDEYQGAIIGATERSGLILEYDISTNTVLRTVSIQPFAQTMYIWNDEIMFVSCRYHDPTSDPPGLLEFETTVTEIIDIESFTIIEEIISGSNFWYPMGNDFIEWDDEFVALLTARLTPFYSDPKFIDAIWLIDPYTGSVVDTIGISDKYNISDGVRHAFRSRLYDDTCYISPGEYWGAGPANYMHEIIIIDSCGEVQERINLPDGFMPGYIYEDASGALIVSGYLYTGEEMLAEIIVLEEQ